MEVVAVARAFNHMNRRIREFVGDETSRVRMVATLDEMESMLAATLSFARDATTLEPKQPVNLSSLIGAICTDMSDVGRKVFFDEMDLSCLPVSPPGDETGLNQLD